MIKPFFKLKNEPFKKDIDTKDVFESESFKELASRLDYIKNNRGLMLITGEPGTGKTIAVRTFIQSLNISHYFIAYTPLSTVSQIEFYRQLNLKLTGKFLHRKVDLFNSIQNAVVDKVSNQKKVPVIIMDEAHLLKGENLYELQILLNYDLDSTNPLIFVMVGQSHLRDKITQSVHTSLNQRFSLKYHVTPMSKSETNEYICHRLSICGSKGNIFSDSAIEAIFLNSQGVPRDIDNLSLKAMTVAVNRRKHTVTEEEVFQASKEV